MQTQYANSLLLGNQTFWFRFLPKQAVEIRYLNARSFERQGFSMVLEEEDLTKETLTSTVYKLFEKRGSYVDAMRNSNQQDSIDTIISMITQASK